MKWDLCRLVFFEKKLEKLDKQMIVHHFVGMSMLATALSGWFVTVYALILLAMELSSIPLCIRRHVSKDSIAEKVNNWAIFIVFTVVRILLPSVLFYNWPADACSVYDRMGQAKFVAYFDFFACASLTVLNCIWYRILLKKAGCCTRKASMSLYE